jgi:cytoskeletal protein CcmA (bactofilin family)
MKGRSKGTGSASRNHLEGVMTLPGGVFDDLSVNGVITILSDLEARRLDLDGVFTCAGNVRADNLDCDGVATIEGNLRVKTVDIDGVLTLNGSKVEADRITCDGVLSIRGQVSADIIEADGFLNAYEIVGDRVTIRSFRKSFFLRTWTRIKESFSGNIFSKVDLVEATTISLQGVHAKTVSGHDVYIGPACKIDRVDCSGALAIDPDAEVGEIVGQAAAEQTNG